MNRNLMAALVLACAWACTYQLDLPPVPDGGSGRGGGGVGGGGGGGGA